jgi:hypothetical protein
MGQLYTNQSPWQYTKKVLIHSGQVLVADRLVFSYNTIMQKQNKPQTPQDQALQRLLEKLRTPELMAVLKRLANK